MKNTNPRIDAYIDKSADFAQPVLEHFRKVVHQAFPEIEETIKWGMPHFEHKGIVCSMAAFKAHCTVSFAKASLLSDPDKRLEMVGRTAMGHLGRIKQLDDLPNKAQLAHWVREVADLNERGIQPDKPKSKPQKLGIPDWFIEALEGNAEARATFDGFSYTNKKEYVEWVTGAKREDTRKRRLATALEWMAEGKVRNWKYINC